jgi:hypothetical protein
MANTDDLLVSLGRVVRQDEEARVIELATQAALVDDSKLEQIVSAVLATTVAVSSGVVPIGASERPTRASERVLVAAQAKPRSVFRASLPALAAAAVLSIVLIRQNTQEATPPTPSAALALNDYSVEVSGAVATNRAVAQPRVQPQVGGPELVIDITQPLVFLLRPEVAVPGELVATAYVVREGHPTSRVVLETEAAPSGALRCVWRPSSEVPEAGSLVLFVGRPDSLDTAPFDGPDRGFGWQRFAWQYRTLTR